ncbi:ORF1 protein [Enset leaf streak virus]|nr:ORF1 protein [Enset leaf streak virus]
MTQTFWEKELENWKNSHNLDKARLDYLDLAEKDKVTNKDLAWNIQIFGYRSDLAGKVNLAATHVAEGKIIKELRKDNIKLQNSVRACKNAIDTQKFEIQSLREAQDTIRKEVSELKEALFQRRPLSKRDVEELVLRISEQPKFIEQQTEALTIELSQKVDKIEKLIHRLEKTLVGE